MPLLSQNSELKSDKIWNWSMPAFAVKLSSGKWFNVCPNAGVCTEMCYARNGTYLFPNVMKKHLSNLEYTLNDIVGWECDMIDEIKAKKNIKYIRIHDAGDFYSDEYLNAWINVIKRCPSVLFYAYTKEVSKFKRIVEPNCPENFKFLYSMGGKEDYLIDLEKDRHADVFPDNESLVLAGYMSQSESDLLAITLPTNKVGIVQNNIKRFMKKLGELTFGILQVNRKNKNKH